MSQPQYYEDVVKEMSNAELADALRECARARKYVSRQRAVAGKEPLDYKLLEEAADRLERYEGAAIHVDARDE